jgi:predicted Zn finger-like uncharacterized protein
VLGLHRERKNLAMIIACSACSARFRIADEKVGPRGARVRCSRCGHTFAALPPEPVLAPPPAPPPEPAFGAGGAHADREPTGTGGWPTGVLDLDASPGSDPPTSAGQSLATDPFAAFAGLPSTPAGEPGPSHFEPLSGAPGGSDADSLPVTDLSALERTGAVPVQAPPDPVPEADGDLALEERTPAIAPAGSRASWSQPEASQAVAIGADGFQEVDLRGGAPADPDFDPLATGSTTQVPLATEQGPAPVEHAAEPGPAATSAGAGPSAAAAATGAVGVPRAAPEVTERRRLQPARVRAAAMNVLSLAALLVVTTGIVAWWRGEGPGAAIRWPWSAAPAAVEVRQVSSGVYEATRGMPVVFVRGALRAGAAPLDGPVSVRVELSRGGRTLSTAVAAAGAVPSTEEVAEVASPEDLARLVASLEARAPRRVEAGAELPFVVLLPAPEGDLGTVRFRVDPVPAKGR